MGRKVNGFPCLPCFPLFFDRLDKIGFREVRIPQNLGKQTWPNCFTGVDGYDRCPSVRMTQKNMTALLSFNNKPAFFRTSMIARLD
jgi:hypothetical protein